MTQVKLFAAGTLDSLEKQINDFLSSLARKSRNIDIGDIKFVDGSETYTAMIIYKSLN